jgi:hypothetical protein
VITSGGNRNPANADRWMLEPAARGRGTPHSLLSRAQPACRGSTNATEPYRCAGLDHDARTVLLTRQRRRRRQLRLPARLWGHLQDVTVGYGYRSTRALAWLLTLIAAVATYTAAHPPRSITGSGPSFNPVAYAVDVVLPILDPGQEKAFIASGVTQWITWTAAVAGWVLATTVIAAVSRILIRE